MFLLCNYMINICKEYSFHMFENVFFSIQSFLRTSDIDAPWMGILKDLLWEKESYMEILMNLCW